ncbi:MAG TPA: iron ABC transporter permease [Candidatus Krumholzibacteria bacterium]|nr:iron ABC transporter permease [Candidatus Krumholzibacteria bacterium]
MARPTSGRFRSRGRALAALALLAVAVLAAAPWWGRVPIDPLKGLAEWWAGDPGTDGRVVALRLPRIVAGFVAGATLAAAGASFQTLLRNALATPYTLGVSFAGAFGAFLALSVPAFSLTVGPLSTITVFALAFSLVNVLTLERFARRASGLGAHELLLAGVTLNFVFGAAILLVRFLSDPLRLRAMDRWMMGGLQIGSWDELAALPLLVVPALLVILRAAPALDQLALGEELAAARGVDVARTQRRVLVAGSLATAAVVAVTGPIGFVGLLAPHAVRALLGAGHRALIPGSMLLGGTFLVVADGVARSITLLGRGSELPVGVLTALLGGPAFLVLLLRQRTRP